MRKHSATTLRTITNTAPAAVEMALLETFAPTRSFTRTDNTAFQLARTALWRSDAIHRAKNLAQLTASLANLAERHDDIPLSPGGVMDARALARAYAELGHDDRMTQTVPCATLLGEIASRLILLFGKARAIATVITAQPLALEPDRRRALVLICSELVINALKYGYPGERGGTIAIRLENVHDAGVLTVEDDGVGEVAQHAPGHGSTLLRDLAAVLDATIVRKPVAGRNGYRVEVTFALGDALPSERPS